MSQKLTQVEQTVGTQNKQKHRVLGLCIELPSIQDRENQQVVFVPTIIMEAGTVCSYADFYSRSFIGKPLRIFHTVKIPPHVISIFLEP